MIDQRDNAPQLLAAGNEQRRRLGRKGLNPHRRGIVLRLSALTDGGADPAGRVRPVSRF
jgi:hypothetical protein